MSLKRISEDDCLLDVDEAAWNRIVEKRGGCRCCISPPCNACTEPITEDELNSVGYTYEDAKEEIMNATERMSGAESAARIARYLESPCGFGTCAGHIDCRDKHCPEHPLQTGLIGLPVIDPEYFDQQLSRTEFPIQFAENETTGLIASIKRDAFWLKWWAAAIGGGLLVALVIYTSTK